MTTPPWWTEEIRVARNKVRAHRRRFQRQQNEELKTQQHILFQKERAKLKKLINKTKSQTWKDYCSKIKNTYGSQYKNASNKNTGPVKLVNVLPPNATVTIKDTLNHFLENLYLTDQVTPHRISRVQKQAKEEEPPVVTRAEINRIIRNIKRNKAPGYT